MHKILRVIIKTTLLSLLTANVLADVIEASTRDIPPKVIDYNGVWELGIGGAQHEYGSIHIKDNTIVFINLKQLETHSNTLAATYSGTLLINTTLDSTSYLTPISRDTKIPYDIYIKFVDQDHGFFGYTCPKVGTCNLKDIALLSMKKIF